MTQFFWAIPFLVACTLISDADQFVGEGDAGEDTGGVDARVADAGPGDSGADSPAPDVMEMDAGPDVPVMDAGPDDARDTGPFMERSCEMQVDESTEDWTGGRCCYSQDHCAGMIVRGMTDNGRCLPDNCGDLTTPLASICIPSADTLRIVFGEDRCYWDSDCNVGEECVLGDTGEYVVATCPDMPPPPGFCREMP